MARAKPEPGPWRCHDNGVIEGPKGFLKIISPWRESAWDESDADAVASMNSMAAAPELLAALKAWEAAIPRVDEFGAVTPGSLRGKALAAIAKAEGRE